MIEEENIYTFSVGLKAFIVDKQGRVLIIKRSKNISKSDFFDFPGGRMRIGESIRNGLIREVKEEANLNISHVYSPLAIVTFIRDIDKSNQIVRIIFWCKATGKLLLNEHDSSEYKWIKPEEYTKYNFLDEYYKLAFKKFIELRNQKTSEFLFKSVPKDSEKYLVK